MTRQIPNWLFAVILVVFTFSFLAILSTAMKPISTASGPMVGEMAPNFSGKMMDGKDFRLSDYRGKVVLVNFWATWCGPCRAEMPDLIKIQEEYKDKGVTVIGLSQDENEEIVKEFLKVNPLNYPVMMLTREIFQGFGSPDGIPVTYLINKEGKIVWSQSGIDPRVAPYAVFSDEINKIL